MCTSGKNEDQLDSNITRMNDDLNNLPIHMSTNIHIHLLFFMPVD